MSRSTVAGDTREITKYIKIVHSAVATNNVMVRRDNKESGLCPCCEKRPETLHHPVAECEELNTARNEMTRNIKTPSQGT